MAIDTAETMSSVGSYDLIDKIAEGGMGAVYRARHIRSQQLVAVKILAPHLIKNPVLLKRFEQEYNAARTIDHPNIIQAIEFSRYGDCPYLVMEFVDGESLGQRLERVARIAESDALRIIGQVAEGLHRAHQLGMVHRDVKPDNILMAHDDSQVKLADLGLVKELETDLSLTRTGRGLGTPHFMAPEQFRNAKNVDVRGDIYSLGATLYQMITGELPFRGCGPLDALMKKLRNELTPPRAIVPNLSERLDWAIRRAMSHDPNQRPATCPEFMEDITPLTDDAQNQVWFLTYRDEKDVKHTVTGTLRGARKSLNSGRLGDAGKARASRNRAGPFEPLRNFAQFRDLVLVPPLPGAAAAMPTPIPTRNKSKSLSPIPHPPAVPATLPAKPNSAPNADTAPRPSKEIRRPSTPAQSFAPQITMETSAGDDGWLKWLTPLLVAAVSAVAGYVAMHW